MKNKKWLNQLKWLWFAVVIAAAGWYFAINFSEMRVYLASIHIGRILISILLLLIAKFMTADLTFYSLRITSHPITFQDAFSITAITQLGKYLPGGLWHFAGKFGVYKARGASTKGAARPMIIENLWLITSAILTGIITLLISTSPLPCQLIPLLCSITNQVILSVSLLLVWMIAAFIVEQKVLKARFSPALHLRLSIEQIIIWLLFGTSFWLVFPRNTNINFFLQAVSAFSLSWAAGYAAFFAPGGIGIREASMTLLLAAFFPPETTAIYAAIHRLLWVVVEILLALLCMGLFGLPLGLEQASTQSDDQKAESKQK